MLKVGGRMVYSTCSFHPLENEAVVARLLQDMQGRLELVDVKEMLPGLDYSPGLETWTPASRQGDLYTSLCSSPAEDRGLSLAGGGGEGGGQARQSSCH